MRRACVEGWWREKYFHRLILDLSRSNQPIQGRSRSNLPIQGRSRSNQPIQGRTWSNQPIQGRSWSNLPIQGRSWSNLQMLYLWILLETIHYLALQVPPRMLRRVPIPWIKYQDGRATYKPVKQYRLQTSLPPSLLLLCTWRTPAQTPVLQKSLTEKWTRTKPRHTGHRTSKQPRYPGRTNPRTNQSRPPVSWDNPQSGAISSVLCSLISQGNIALQLHWKYLAPYILKKFHSIWRFKIWKISKAFYSKTSHYFSPYLIHSTESGMVLEISFYNRNPKYALYLKQNHNVYVKSFYCFKKKI